MSKLVRVRVGRVSVVSIINYTLHHAFAHTHTHAHTHTYYTLTTPIVAGRV